MASAEPGTRERILAATHAALLEGDGLSTRMSDIARLAGVSRQALYLHFENRSALLIATARYIDEIEDVDARLAASRAATTGRERLDLYIEAWGNYIPVIHPLARVLLTAAETDAAAAQAWADRMEAVRHGCAAAVAALRKDGDLAEDLDEPGATVQLCVVLAYRTWEQLRFEAGLDQADYLATVRRMAHRVLSDGGCPQESGNRT